MGFDKLRAELRDFYDNIVNDNADAFNKICVDELERRYVEGMSAYQMKALQYETIVELCEPVIFDNSPFYYEMGTMVAHCDGANIWRGGHEHAGGWTYRRNRHLYADTYPDLLARARAQKRSQLYLICGDFCDELQHFQFNYRPLLSGGLKGVYEKVLAQLENTKTDEEREYLNATAACILSLKRLAEKFAEAAEARIPLLTDEEARANAELIAKSARRVPWEAPQTLYEALNTYAFMRKAGGALEGIGFNTFGRPDLDLYPIYKRELERGDITEDEALSLISQFLLTWDCHYDHDMKMVGYADHEFENTYVIGGCDAEGNPVWNDLTRLFIKANRDEKIIYPKIKARFGSNSPREYLDELNKAVLAGNSAILYQNDDMCIPALVRHGRTLEEARDYIASGCWDIKCNGIEKPDAGAYVNLLRVFEMTVHNDREMMEKVQLELEPFDGAKGFDELYDIMFVNFKRLFKVRAEVTALGAPLRAKVDPLMLTSMTMEGCLDKRKDFTAGGAKYNDDIFYFVGFPNIVDSLIAIKTLCFDKKICTLGELLMAVRADWRGYDELRAAALSCNCWGDASKTSTEMSARLWNDLYAALGGLQTRFGGKIGMGHLTYTEIRFWGEMTKATPDGRLGGSCFSQGLTPSRLHKIDSATTVVASARALDFSKCAGNSVVNMILPAARMTPEIFEALLRSIAVSGFQSLQLNCVTKEELLDAQIHPEAHEDLVVRVTGFSARFTALSEGWQEEFLSRNFYE